MNPAGAQGLYRPVLCALLSSELAGAGANDVVLSASGPFGPQDQIGSFMVFLYQCFSRGRLVLTSTDPDALPDVDMRQLSDERDRVRARFALSRAAELAASSAFDDVITATPVARDGTSFSEIVSMSASEFDEWIPKVGRDVAHMCSTCRMGSPDDAATVVDPDCRVLGVDGLRVIDASIFPSVTRSNTNFPTIMVAERMSDVIRGVALAAPIDLSTDVPA
jgi:choline dehydrogenase